MIALKGTPTGNFTPTRKIRPLIHATLSPTKAKGIGQICLAIRTRFGIYVTPDALMVLLLSDPTVVKDYTDELRFRSRVATKTLPEYFGNSDNYANSFMVNTHQV